MADEMDRLTQELDDLLTPLEKEAAEFVEKKRTESVLTQTKEELRAKYSQTVPGVLREVAALEKKLGPCLARVGPALDALGRAGVAQWHLTPVHTKLNELSGRLAASGLGEILGMIGELQPDYCSLTGQPMGSAEIRLRLRGAESLVADIHKHYEELVAGLAVAAKAPRQARQVTTAERPLNPRPDTSRMISEFNPLA